MGVYPMQVFLAARCRRQIKKPEYPPNAVSREAVARGGNRPLRGSRPVGKRKRRAQARAERPMGDAGFPFEE